MRFFAFFLFALVAVLLGSLATLAQNADNRTSPYGREQEEDRPLSIKETMVKLRIEKEKKDYDKMLDRGQEALKIAGDLEKAFDGNGRLSDSEVIKLAALEKLSKQIRRDLGGDDDDEFKNFSEKTSSVSHFEAIKTLKSAAEELFRQLKKTTRFTISAAAIQSSNAVLRLSRILRFSN